MTVTYAPFEPRARLAASADHSPALHPATLLAALSVVSALFTNAFPGPAAGPANFQFPALPGVYFGLVLVAGTACWATTRWWRLLAVFAAVNAGWAAAYVASDHAYGGSVGGTFWSCGLLGGAIGAILTIAGIACASPNFRTFDNFVRTFVIGAVAGLLLECGADPAAHDALPIHVGSLLPLFVVWQAGVAASIAYGLTTPTRCLAGVEVIE